MHKTVFMWFGNLPMSTKLQGFRHYQGKIQYIVRLQFFSFIKTRQLTHNNNPNHQSRFHNGLNGQKKKNNPNAPGPPRGLSMSTSAWSYRPKPSLHGLNLSKSSIKNHTILFGSGHRIGSSKTRLHKAQQRYV